MTQHLCGSFTNLHTQSCEGFMCLFSYASTALFVLSAGDIGGQMGLFIGASILTILELFDYLYEVDTLFPFSLLLQHADRCHL